MIKRMLRGDKKTFFLSLIFVFLAISIVLLISTTLFQADINKEARLKTEITERSLVEAEQYFITYKINRLTSDLKFICDSLQEEFPQDGDFGHVAQLWLAYSNSREIFDQIRFLNPNGDEIIRVDYSPDGAFVVPQDQLQNKKDRYYFKDSIDLDADQIYISNLDLNIENGSIELPINPMIRLSQPFFDQNGVKQGLVVLNYSASDILQQIASVAAGSAGDVFFLNKEGYWLFNSTDSYTEWAFSYNSDSLTKFPSYYTREWDLISAGGSGTMLTENGYFYYTTIPVNTICESNSAGLQIVSDIDRWYIVSHIPYHLGDGAYPSGDLWILLRLSFEHYYFLYLFALIIATVLAGYITSSKTRSKEVKFFSEFDVMTNALNRRSGIGKLNDLYRSLSKTACTMSVCFIDINGLKEINDTLGHETGDELIITVAKTIRAVIRTGDFLIRLGGDEFLIVLQGIDEETAEEVWQRIVASFETINNTENRNYIISVSHGIEMLNCDLNQVLDRVLHQADIKMYDEKRRIKSNLQIIRK